MKGAAPYLMLAGGIGGAAFHAHFATTMDNPALWPFAACTRRMVTPYSVLLFHPMKWQSEEHVGPAEAAEWARHFSNLEQDMDSLLAELLGLPPADMEKWITPGRYVSGREMAEAGLAELIDLRKIKAFQPTGTTAAPRRRKRVPSGIAVSSEASRPAAQRR
ncbi:hypothetical protein LCGC14_2911930 [marine sediment metagenome]|uniref:Uncharacterized protein n=1 Tax=marine sediment metagenome TaxID=412755 RepID=A0A0F8XRE4_9ZZZZ